MIVLKKLISKIDTFFKKVNKLNSRYEITLESAATSFYIIVALFSIIVLGIQIYSVFSDDLEDFIVSKVFEIINPIYHSVFQDISPVLSLNSFSIVILINFFWSSSKILNGYNNVADRIYEEVKIRKGYIKRLSSFLMFLMLLFIVLFEIAFIVITDRLIKEFFNNLIILHIIQFILELLILFFTISILYIYAPPVKMRVKDVFTGAVISTVSIYIILVIFILIFDIYRGLNITYSALTIVSMSFLFLYIINVILIVGIVINYRINKFGRIFHK